MATQKQYDAVAAALLKHANAQLATLPGFVQNAARPHMTHELFVEYAKVAVDASEAAR